MASLYRRVGWGDDDAVLVDGWGGVGKEGLGIRG